MEVSKNKRRLQFWAGMAISALSLAAIFIFIDPSEIAGALRSARYGYLALSGLGIVAFLMIRAVRWRFMLENQVSWAKVFHIQNIGYMLTYVLPLRLGDVARAVLIGNVPPVTLPQGISTMIVERVLDFLFIAILLPFTLSAVETVPENIQVAARVSGVLALSATALLVLAANQRPLVRRLLAALIGRIPRLSREKWVNRVDELLAGLSKLTNGRDALILLGLSAIVWLPIIYAYYASLIAVGISPTPAMAGFVVCAAALSITAPSSPGQVGVFHAGVTFALVQVLGQPEGPSASFAFLYHALNLVLVIILGVIGVYRIGATFRNVVAAAQSMVKSRR